MLYLGYVRASYKYDKERNSEASLAFIILDVILIVAVSDTLQTIFS